jgi:transcriptional regulator with XRE-family HTH domain
MDRLHLQPISYIILTINMTRNVRRSAVLVALRERKDPLESERVRTSMMLSARIAAALKAKGWNKGQLAAALKKNPSIITRWLSGTHNFTSDTLSDIQKVLGIQLLVRSDDEQKPMYTSYSFSDLQFQTKILDKENIRSLVEKAAQDGGCCVTGAYTATVGLRSENAT